MFFGLRFRMFFLNPYFFHFDFFHRNVGTNLACNFAIYFQFFSAVHNSWHHRLSFSRPFLPPWLISRWPEYSPPEYAVDANLFRLESSMLTRAKRATNRNNIATENRVGWGIFRGGVYLEPISLPLVFGSPLILVTTEIDVSRDLVKFFLLL